MSSVEELPGTPDRPSLIGRLVAPADELGGDSPGRRRNASAALLTGGLALGAFAASLVYEWGITTVDTSGNTGDSTENGFTVPVSIGSVDNLGLVYLLGGVALLGFVGTAITRPDLAARLRMPLLGITGGLLAVVVALMLRLIAGDTAIGQLGGGYYVPFELRDRLNTTVQPGLYLALAAVVLPGVSVFLAARPITRTRASAPVPAAEPQGGPESPAATPWVSTIRAEGATGLTVSAADPHDRHAGTDVWRPGSAPR